MATQTRSRRHTSSSTDYDLHGDVAKIKEAIAKAAEDFKGRSGEIFSESVDGIKEQSTFVKDSVANYTAEKPFKSLGIAALAGLALGILIRR